MKVSRASHSVSRSQARSVSRASRSVSPTFTLWEFFEKILGGVLLGRVCNLLIVKRSVLEKRLGAAIF